MKTIYVFLAEGFEEVEALTPVDVLRRAGLPVKIVSVTGVLTVNGAHGVPVIADMVFEEVKEADTEMIVLPGGLPGATNLDAHKGLSDLIMAFAEAGKPLSAICAAPLVYGKVVDMFYFPIIETNWPTWMPFIGGKHFIFFSPIFNFADAAISCGIIALLLFYSKYLNDSYHVIKKS